MFTPFMILSSARSGTNLMRSIINQIPQKECLGEIFRAAGDSTKELMRLTGQVPTFPMTLPEAGPAQTDREG